VIGEFRNRVRLYEVLDRRLAQRTRFFGAAAVTNAALADLFGQRGSGLLVGRRARDYLCALGKSLERMNMDLAERILTGEICSLHLDYELVATEQTAVEVGLSQLRRMDDTGYSRTVVQMDRLLAFVKLKNSPANRYSTGATFARVLRLVSNERGHVGTFADQGYRECVGRGLISELRASSVR
jgi:hypothetical protein